MTQPPHINLDRDALAIADLAWLEVIEAGQPGAAAIEAAVGAYQWAKQMMTDTGYGPSLDDLRGWLRSFGPTYLPTNPRAPAPAAGHTET